MTRGNVPRDGGFLSGLPRYVAESIRSTDPFAARLLRPWIVPQTFRRDVELWCLWADGLSAEEVATSEVLSQAATEVANHRGDSAIPPWEFAEQRQPSERFFAVPLEFPRALKRVPVFEFDPGLVINGKVASISEPGVVTAGVVMSRPYRVWLDVVGSGDSSKVVLAPMGAHNTFPCPDLTPEQRHAIRNATNRVFTARTHGIVVSLDELYERKNQPPGLAAAHNNLDAIMCEVFGLDADADDQTIRDRLLALYSSMSSAA